MLKEKKTTTVLKVPTYNPDDESKNKDAELEVENKVEPLKFKNNKKGNIRAFTNAANISHLKGKPLYLDMSKMISVFSDENDITIIHNGNLGWQVAEQLDEVVNIWKSVSNS